MTATGRLLPDRPQVIAIRNLHFTEVYGCVPWWPLPTTFWSFNTLPDIT
jgi:hypothetical protein